ncbi:MAG: hypothetical protein AABX86_01685 [Nanoarchaeota archaeon]
MLQISSSLFFSVLPVYLVSLLKIFLVAGVAFVGGKIVGKYTQEEMRMGRRFILFFLYLLVVMSFLFLLFFFHINSTSWFFTLMLFFLPLIGGFSLYYGFASFYHGMALGMLFEFFLIPTFFVLTIALEGSFRTSPLRLLLASIIGVVFGLTMRYLFLMFGIVNILI